MQDNLYWNAAVWVPPSVDCNDYCVKINFLTSFEESIMSPQRILLPLSLSPAILYRRSEAHGG